MHKCRLWCFPSIVKKMKIVGVIPAHLASVRLERKILKNFFGLPMIEHVRRRAKLSNLKNDIYIATCDKEIEDEIIKYNGKVIRTGKHHKNGTTRVSEAIRKIDCTHVILLQGDEPLLLPDHVNQLISAMEDKPKYNAWNATGEINNISELERHSFVKCMVGIENKILSCFRKTPCFSELSKQQKFIRKILGIIGYSKEFLIKITKKEPTPIESAEFIEQMRILEHGYDLYSVPVNPSLPSVNEPHEVKIVYDYLEKNKDQKKILEKILNQ